MKRILIALSLLVLCTLPTHATLVGTTPGEFAVSPSGAATYTVPIELPPTVGGVKPSLALSYNSQAGNGIAGIGWWLSGLSSITRCPTTLAQDGFIDGVDFDGNDKFCLDGQRLVAAADGTYRTEIDSFSKIVGYGSVDNAPATFKVWTKAGEVMEYALEDMGGSSNPMQSWMLQKVSDSLGNYFTVSYHVSGQPETIHFYSSEGEQNPYSTFFNYEKRGDKKNAYQFGRKYEQYLRLKSIELKKNGIVNRTYSLFYKPGHASILSEIKRCELSDIQCNKGINFSWQDSTAKWEKNSRLAPPVSIVDSKRNSMGAEFIDLNGDGLIDFLRAKYNADGSSSKGAWINEGTQWKKSNSYEPPVNIVNADRINYGARFIDVNGDGLVDFLRSRVKKGSTQSYAWLNNGSGWTKSNSYRVPVSIVTEDLQDQGARFIDLNGDGLPDFLRSRMKHGKMETKAWLNTGKGWKSAPQFAVKVTIVNTKRRDQGARFVDLNGDGLPDFVRSRWEDGKLNSKAWINTGDGWRRNDDYAPRISIVSSDNKDQGARFIDLNNDGLVDLVRSRWDGHEFRGELLTKAWINTGKGWQRHNGYAVPVSIASNSKEDQGVRFIDLNADGLIDVTRSRWKDGSLNNDAWINTGSNWKSANNYAPPVSYVTDDRKDQGARLVDLNGDGILDIARSRWTGEFVTGAWVNTTKSPVITEISIGSINSQKIDYSYTSNSHAYKGRPSYKSYPKVVFNSPQKIVRGVTMKPSGNIKYFYESFKVDKTGRGSLGFEKIAVKNEQTNTFTSTVYNQNYPLIGIPKSSVTTLDGKKIAESSSQYDFTETENSSLLFVYPTNSIQKSWSYDSGGTTTLLYEIVTSNNSFDTYGNPTSITVVTNDAAGNPVNTTETTNFYDNTEHNWHLGRLRTATVTHTPASGVAITKSSAFAYDLTTGLLTQEVIEPNNPLHKLVTNYEYDSYGNRTKVTVTGNHKNYDANGNATLGAAFVRETNTEYLAGADHPAGLFPTKVTNAKGHSESRVYDPLYGNVLSTTGPNGITTTFEYDALGRKTKTIPAVGKSSSTSYNWCIAGGNCPDSQGYFITKSVADVTGSAMAYFDRYGRAVRNASTDRNNALIYTDTEYDNLSRVKRVSEPSYTPGDWSKFTQSYYDAAGRVDQIKRPDGLMAPKTIFNGFTTTTYDVKGRATVSTKNALGQTIRIEDPANGSVNYTYDAVGNLTKTSTCEAGNNCIDVDLEYDLRGNKIKMIDPDMGTWLYGYNTLGELTWQKDAKSQVTQMEYDVLGRMDKRTDHDGTVSKWVYDTAAGKGVGKLHKVLYKLAGSSTTATFKELSYDNIGRPVQTISTIDGFTYATNSTYDSVFGRLDTLKYPSANNATGANRSGLTLKYNYSTTGHLSSVVNADQLDTQYWTAGTVCDNKLGALCTQFLGIRSTAVDGFDGIQVSSTYDNVNPWLVSQMANKVGDIFNPYQAFTYDYDNVGNLLSREQAGYAIGGTSDAKIERFDYDTYLDRVTGATTNDVVTGAYAYDGLGNITFKNDVGSYTYGTAASSCNADSFAGPHAVTQTTLNGVVTNYCYDANGNLVNGNGRNVTWNSFNKPLRMTQNGKWAEFSYGPNRSRYKKTSSDLVTTHYVGMGGTGNVLYEKEIQTNGDYVARNHIYVGGKRIAVKLDYHNAQINDPEVVHYMLGDHLGSVTTIVNQDGNVVRRKSFDVWGKARNADTWSGTAALDTDNHRGYTGHEAIQEVGLVHMNGRVYDATLARFVSADPHIQSAGSSQSYNRYSYVWNNPLKNTDPSGYFLKKIGKELRRAGKRIDRQVRRSGGYGTLVGAPTNLQIGYHTHAGAVRNVPYYAAVSTAVATKFGGAIGNALVSGLNAHIMGANSSAAWKIAGKAFENAMAGGLVSYGIGHMNLGPLNAVRDYNAFGLEVGRAGLHAVAQGGLAEAQGGSFKAGAGSAFFSSIVPMGRINSETGRVIAASIIGGTASELSGGKFSNGAMTGAFVRLFNHEIGEKFKPMSCANAEYCSSAKRTFGSGDEINSYVTGKNMVSTFKNTSIGLLGGYIGGAAGMLMSGGAIAKSFAESRVTYSYQIGDSIIQEIRGNYSRHYDFGLENVHMRQTVINSEGVITHIQADKDAYRGFN